MRVHLCALCVRSAGRISLEWNVTQPGFFPEQKPPDDTLQRLILILLPIYVPNCSPSSSGFTSYLKFSVSGLVNRRPAAFRGKECRNGKRSED